MSEQWEPKPGYWRFWRGVVWCLVVIGAVAFLYAVLHLIVLIVLGA